jgi:hypothetical protein
MRSPIITETFAYDKAEVANWIEHRDSFLKECPVRSHMKLEVVFSVVHVLKRGAFSG